MNDINNKRGELHESQSRQFSGRKLNISSLLEPALRVGSVVMLGLIFTVATDSFLSISNLVNILRQASVLLVLAAGMTIVILTGGIDLSIGGVMTLAGCLAAYMMRQSISIWISAVAALGVAVFLGILNGVLIGYVGLPPFVATYGILWIARGLAMVLMQGQIIFGLPSEFRLIGTGHIGSVPVIVVITAFMCLIVHLLLSRTVFGCYIYAIGANQKAAYYSGVKNRLITMQQSWPWATHFC